MLSKDVTNSVEASTIPTFEEKKITAPLKDKNARSRYNKVTEETS